MADAGGAAAPSGYHTVTPRLVVHDVDSVVSFLRGVFDAVGTVDAGRPVELLIGDSIVMVSGAGVRQPFPAFSMCTSRMPRPPTAGPCPPAPKVSRRPSTRPMAIDAPWCATPPATSTRLPTA